MNVIIQFIVQEEANVYGMLKIIMKLSAAALPTSEADIVSLIRKKLLVFELWLINIDLKDSN